MNSCLNGTSTESYKIVGALLVSAILVNVVALAVSFAGCVKSWATAVALVLTWLGGIVAVAAIAYYFNKLDPTYCPALAVTGIIFALVMTIRGTTCLTFGLSLSILFLILSVALPHWSCGTILHSCLNETSAGSYRTVGALLVCAILVDFVAVLAAIAGCVIEESCATPAARWLTWFGGILAIAAIAYYFNKVDTTYCPELAVTGIIFALATAIITPIRCIL
ncbi:unnamed protein product [Dibothriocephalus latus]|uniref:Uncharacterized protein n=1 Tax=Dibothriocephalus latus TaxID=60516 RepID=A0A3P7LRU4_DIBLA|nr:unnamed protein product [Dibothriocephalus latus]